MEQDNQTDFWNRVAFSRNFTHPLQRNWISRYLSEDAVIVDYGCGYGRIVRELRELGFDGIKGFDTSKELIRRGRESGETTIFHFQDLNLLPVENDSADFVVLFAVLTCIPSNEGQMALVNALSNKLKKHGILYISDYYLQEDLSEVKSYTFLNGRADNYGVFTIPEGAMFRHHTKSWIEKLFENFEILETAEIPVFTMNGHQAKAFQMIMRKV